jgi:four helix bundle protein
MSYFDHEKLDVYRAAIRLNILADKMIEELPRGRSYIADQLQRAGTSILLNIAEGAGEYASSEKLRFYRMAKRSATECAAIFDLCRALHLIEEKCYEEIRELLARIVAMLIRMAQGSRQRESGPHTHTLTHTN